MRRPIGKMRVIAITAIVCWTMLSCLHAAPKTLHIDTDMDNEDGLALMYLLKQPRSQIHVKAITINANSWSNAGSAINTVYDILYMMDREDILVGIGGEGGITDNGTILPNVGGYLPIIDQGLSTAGGCRYREAIPPGQGGRLDVDTNYGLRRQFLPQGERHYVPLKQRTAQEVLVETLSEGPTTILLLGAHTNLGILLLSHPELKKNIEHIYIMGGGVHSSNPTGCCPSGSGLSCIPAQCGNVGNLFSAYHTNPWAEFNIFTDPFSAYQVFHSGVPITHVPLDVTNYVPVSQVFLSTLGKNPETLEAQYVYQTFNILRETWFDDNFYNSFFLWDSFASAVTISGMLTGHNPHKNKYAVIHPKNITVLTSDKPYGINDGSNPFFDNRTMPKFHLQKGGVHSGHVQTGIQDPFCLVPDGKGTCMDGYTKEVQNGGALIQVALLPKPNKVMTSTLKTQFYADYIHDLNLPTQTARFNFESEFLHFKKVFYRPNLSKKILGKPVIFDMDMSPGDFITLFYLLKTPVELINLTAITVTTNGWANPAAIDIVYDVLHMMGRDDIPVGLGSYFALNQSFPPFHSTGNCKYSQAIPLGSGGLLDSDTFFGLARELPRSPRSYTAQNSVKFGAPRTTDHPELRQPLANEVLLNVFSSLNNEAGVTILSSGPLTNIATLLLANSSLHTKIKELYIMGGSIAGQGNLYTIPKNTKAEFNFFLDPEAALVVLNSQINITLIPLDITGKIPLSEAYLDILEKYEKTPELEFVHKLLSTTWMLHSQGGPYNFAQYLLGDPLAAAVLVNPQNIRTTFNEKKITVESTGDISTDGWTKVDKAGVPIRYVSSVDKKAYELHLAAVLSSHTQTAVVPSFASQKKQWGKL
ncbi:hypothetical protein O6H91_09G012800 [Diphasiastrum complanatum]|uniref:Uncharacterized protein n=2 Tax=Diphasiastrum complanatum TaxID=34168 RepID=A0ACC2CLD9_DIPCM|nr:hypothetical protein O6H91_09G012800 [Diphasiastrum complanatum]KAJ7542803.1 hypothetical protein O6H91_09G012800 [Diphasiastrum complanatum]